MNPALKKEIRNRAVSYDSYRWQQSNWAAERCSKCHKPLWRLADGSLWCTFCNSGEATMAAIEKAQKNSGAQAN
jgi:hypothetical protein